MSKISALDLNAEQTEVIEHAVGIPIQRWGTDPDVSVVLIFRHILAAVNGDGIERYRAMSNRQVMELVTMDEGEDPDPLPQSELAR